MTKKPDVKPPVEVRPNVAGELPEIADTHAPFLYFEHAPAYGYVPGVIRITLEASRDIQAPNAPRGVVTERAVVAYLRCNVPAALSLRAALDAAPADGRRCRSTGRHDQAELSIAMTFGWWDRLAATLQAANRISEADKDDRYTAAEVCRSVVYTREDLTMVVAHLSALNRQVCDLLCLVRVLIVLVAGALAVALGHGLF